jgi:hypothetical protein
MKILCLERKVQRGATMAFIEEKKNSHETFNMLFGVLNMLPQMSSPHISIIKELER